MIQTDIFERPFCNHIEVLKKKRIENIRQQFIPFAVKFSNEISEILALMMLFNGEILNNDIGSRR